MHWIIQSNLVDQKDAARLREALVRLNTPFTDVNLIPFVKELEYVPQIAGPVFVYGSTFVHRSAYDQGWSPGYVGGNQSYEEIAEHYGSELLNSDCYYVLLKDLTVKEPLFVRPEDDGKLFTGCVLFDQQGLDELRQSVVGHAGSEMALNARVVVSTPKSILAEYRTIVINGQVVCASSYRRGGRVFCSDQVDERVLAYAQKQADVWCPDIGFALDVADTDEGLKIIEINALSSSGLYACDLIKFVSAVNSLPSLCLARADKHAAGP